MSWNSKSILIFVCTWRSEALNCVYLENWRMWWRKCHFLLWFLNVLLMRTGWQHGHFEHIVIFLSWNYAIAIKAYKLVSHKINLVISVPQDLLIPSEIENFASYSWKAEIEIQSQLPSNSPLPTPWKMMRE